MLVRGWSMAFNFQRSAVGAEGRPVLPVNEVRDEPAEHGRVLDLVLGLPEYDPQGPRLPPQPLQEPSPKVEACQSRISTSLGKMSGNFASLANLPYGLNVAAVSDLSILGDEFEAKMLCSRYNRLVVNLREFLQLPRFLDDCKV